MKILHSLAIAFLVIGVSAPCFAANEGHDPLTTLDALNHALVSVCRVERQPSKITVDEEYNGIINNLAVGNITEDTELRNLFARMMDAYTENPLDAKDREMLRRQYEAQVNRAFLEVKPLSHIQTEALSDGGEPWYATFAKAAGSALGAVGEYQIALQATERVKMQAQGQKQEYMQQRMAGEWELDKERIRRFNALKGSLLDAGWTLLNRYNLPDEYRLTENNLDQFYPFISEKDVKKALRMGKRLETNFSKYPPYWFYMGSFYLQGGDLQQARSCFEKFEEVSRPIFRKDAYAAANARYKIFTLDEKEKDEAKRLLDIIEKQVTPDDWNTVLFAALQNYHLGNTQKAEELVLQNIDNGHDVPLNKEILRQIQRGKLDFSAVQGVAIRELKEPGLLEKLAKAGNPEAQYVYGELQRGKNLIFWMEQAARQGHFFAKCALIYANPQKYKNEIKSTFAELEAKSKTGDASALNCLGLYYGKGIGTTKDEKESFSLYQKAAEQGFAVAQVHLGSCYRTGTGTTKDDQKAFFWYQKAAEQGLAAAQFNLGSCYRTGTGTTRDGQKAFFWYQKAAEQGDAAGQTLLGDCYRLGIGTTKDGQKAFFWYQKAAEQGLATAQATLGFYYQKGIGTTKDDQKAFFWYQKAAEQGLAVEQVMLGIYYQNGTGTTKDDQKAFFWYQKAAEQGNALGQTLLGDCYRTGTGTTRDGQKAFFWYQKAAEQGFTFGQGLLGDCYLNGIGTTKDGQKAFFWYQKAAEQGDAVAQVNLGYCYRDGIGVDKDDQKAFFWYQKAAEQGNASGQNQLGNCYQNGIGATKDEQKAFFWSQKAAEQGHASGQNRLGYCYQHGIGATRDGQKAFFWYQKAAEQGLAAAQVNLGACYLDGIGVDKDEQKAFFWYQKAAEQGLAYAQYVLGLCYQRGIGTSKNKTLARMWYQRAAAQGDADAQKALERL